MGGVLMVFLGGGLGAAARFGVTTATLRLFGPALPWGTLTVNVIGSLAMGVLWAAVSAYLDTLPVQVRLFVATGFLGGFTTFSAFSLDALLLWERGDSGLAAAYVVASVVLSIAALAAGFALARAAMLSWLV
ncbi:MAG: fluoride efflux transporter CrcB [Alphaproteobacteria bacterium]